MYAIQTARLSLRPLIGEDAPFILELMNEPSFLQNIGDRGIRTLADARAYIVSGPVASYNQNGFGLLLVELASVPIGICGLLKRDGLEHPDLGFALLPRFWSQGYARECAAAVLDHAAGALGLTTILAITAPGNWGSIRLLQKLGFEFKQMICMTEAGCESKLFRLQAKSKT